jgi:uncharacterized protein
LDVDDIIGALSLARHPEGGWYRETFRDVPEAGGRGALTQMYYLLRAGESSRWHRIDAVEVWHFYLGEPLALQIAQEGWAPRTVILGNDLARAHQPQAVVPAQAWQAAKPLGAFALVGCTVAPAFQFDGFELAPDGWSPRTLDTN